MYESMCFLCTVFMDIDKTDASNSCQFHKETVSLVKQFRKNQVFMHETTKN